MLVAGSSVSGMVMGSGQKRKLSMPLGLSATAKYDLRSAPSTRTTRQYLPFHFSAPLFSVALHMMRCMRKGLSCSLKSYFHSRGTCSAVSMGYLYFS